MDVRKLITYGVDRGNMEAHEQPRDRGNTTILHIDPKKLHNHLKKHSLYEPPKHLQEHPQTLPTLTHEQQLQAHRLKHRFYAPEQIRTISDQEDRDPLVMRTPFEYAQLTPEFSKVSHHFLNCTAYSPHISMSKGDQMRASGKDVDTIYALIARSSTKCPPLLKSSAVEIDEAAVDYDRLGNLFEYGDWYYLMFEHPTLGVRGGFKAKANVGLPLVQEWRSIVKQQVGAFGIAATGEYDETQWHVHSAHVMALRIRCAYYAEHGEKARKAETAEKARKGEEREVGFKEFGNELERGFDGVVEKYFGDLEKKKRREREEAEDAWMEFMVDEEEEMKES